MLSEVDGEGLMDWGVASQVEDFVVGVLTWQKARTSHIVVAAQEPPLPLSNLSPEVRSSNSTNPSDRMRRRTCSTASSLSASVDNVSRGEQERLFVSEPEGRFVDGLERGDRRRQNKAASASWLCSHVPLPHWLHRRS
jgi:hypothetical protein